MSKEVAKQTESDLPVLPKQFIGMGTGLQNVEEKDLLIPRINVASGNSKALAKGTEQYVPGLSGGDIYSTVTGHIYGPEILVAPLWYSNNRVLFDPNGKIECTSPDGKTGGQIEPKGCEFCKYSAWESGKDGVGTACTLFLNFAVAILGNGPATLGSISFKNTSTRVSNKWNTLIQGRRALNPDTGDVEQVLSCLGMYTYSVVTVNGKKGAYYAPNINNAVENKGMVPDKDVQRVLELYLRFKNRELKISSAEVELDG